MAEKSQKLQNLTEEEINERHADKMRKKKAVRDKILATKTDEKGLVIVNTGQGQGQIHCRFWRRVPRARPWHEDRRRAVRQGLMGYG